jgi:class 3 adenylate cyclase/tetratricopeptide (TPR) repeat protein
LPTVGLKMDCPSCGHPNPEGARFCGNCATALTDAINCPHCGARNPHGQRFCNACGHSLTTDGDAAAAKASSAAPASDPRSLTPDHLAEKIRAGREAIEGERKQVTVLFADVMGSMELAERSDPEEWRRIMERFFSTLCEGIHRFEGTVDKFTGDGIMALFGAPIAHEDHGRRACYAALRLQDELAANAAELRREHGLSLSVRMGINSGEVVVGAIGEDLAMDYTAIGHTVGLAQRMEQLAEPGKAYLTSYTAPLVEGYLAIEDLGEFQVKGVSHPVNVYELRGIGQARGRLDVSQTRGFSTFVGRDEEMRVLEDALERSSDGSPQVIGIVGEAGVGKSRLCREFIERHRARGLPVYQVAGQAHASSIALLPVLELMRAYFDITELDSDQAARERIAGKLLLLDDSFADDLPLIFDFLAVPDPEHPSPRMDPEARQRHMLDLTKRLIHAQSAREPGINLFEDLHWIDPASEAFLANHVEATQGTRSLTIVNFRPEYRAAWMSKSYYRQIALSPLGAEAIEEMLADLLGSDSSLEGLPELVRERTAGNPFFTEEVVQSLIESGALEGERGAYRLARPVTDEAVPASVQSVLAARIDRLNSREKSVLQAAAVIGKEFAEPVLRRVVDVEPDELEESLRELVSSEFVYPQELYPEAVYAFKHPLTQEVAEGSQLGERRAAIHAAVARAIAERYPERLDERAALLAQHWEAAGDELEAARWHARAAAWSGTRDPTESLGHWRKVRELAATLPESEESGALGLTARIFSLQYGWRLGMSHEEGEEMFTEAERMASAAGDVRSRAILLSVYAGIKGINDGDFRGMAEMGRNAVALAEESADPAIYITVAGTSYGMFVLGEFRDAIATVNRALELANGDPTVGAGLSVGCPYAYCLIFKGGYVANLGELDEATELIGRGTAMAREQGDIETAGWGHMWQTWLADYKGDPDGALANSQQSLGIAERLGDAFSRTWASSLLGLAEGMRGDWARAVEVLERAMDIARERRTAADNEQYRVAMLAEAYLGVGDGKRAVELAEQAVNLARVRDHRAAVTFVNTRLAKVLLAVFGARETARIEATLKEALDVARVTSSRIGEATVLATRAELARQAGDEDLYQRDLADAHRLFVECGARGHAERLASQLTTTA